VNASAIINITRFLCLVLLELLVLVVTGTPTGLTVAWAGAVYAGVVLQDNAWLLLASYVLRLAFVILAITVSMDLPAQVP
jgi:hypothetical protein